jgi:IPT/TIG domain-containing protein
MRTTPVANQSGRGPVLQSSKSVRKSRLFLVFVVVITFLVSALLMLHGLKARHVDASAITSLANSDAVIQAPAPLPSDDQIMSFAYFIEQGDMNSTLRLNNNLLAPMKATVTFFNSQGESFTAPLLTLPPQDVQRFRVSELTANAPGDFHTGSVQVFYHGPPMAVTGQISVASASSHMIFESFPTMAMGFASSRLDGIVWTPDAGTQASAALTNTMTDMLTVKIGTATDIKSLTLNAHETQVVDLREFLINRQDAGAALVRVLHDGTPGAVIVTGFALNEKTGFSCNLPFIDRATAKTAHLAGAHVRFGRPGSKEGFPAGTRFNAPLLIANTGDQPTEARVFVDYTISGVAARAQVAKLELATEQVRQVELSSAMARLAGSGPVDDAGLDIEYSGSPGAVIARLTSVDQSGDYAFDVPIKDPLAEMQRVGGSYPWRVDGGFTTVLHLKNTINQPVFALVQVRYPGGSYNLERLPLAPFQTIAVDLRSLRDGQQKDIRDSVMPSDVEGGQVVWFEETIGSLIGRAEVTNVAEGVASSFSCNEPCSCPPNSSNTYLTPGSSVGPMGGTAQFSSMEQRQDCHGTVFGPYNQTSNSTWSSSDTSVFTVSSGLVSCLQPGSGTVTAQFQTTVYGQWCAPISIYPMPSGSVAVKPKITSLSPARGVQGIEYNLTITGMGFKSPASVNVAGAGITVSGTQVGSSTEIITTFTIASDATGGNHAVTVTVSNQTSDGVNFYVQIPTTIRQDSIDAITTCDPTRCTIGTQQNACGAYRLVHYTLVDQANPAQPIAEMATVTETVKDLSVPNDPGTSKSIPTNEDGAFDDLLALFKITTCPSLGESASVSQTFTATVGNKTFTLTRANRIDYMKSTSGQYSITITVTTP